MVGLTDETKATLAKYRMEKAYTALAEGKFSTLFEKRHANDYEDFIETNKEEAEVFVGQAEIFVNSAEKIVKG